MKKLILLILFFLIINVNAETIGVRVIDISGNFGETFTIYQNDNYSKGHVQTINLSNGEPFDLSANHGFTMVLEPKYNYILSSPNEEYFLTYWFDYLKFWSFAGIILLILVVSIYKLIKN